MAARPADVSLPPLASQPGITRSASLTLWAGVLAAAGVVVAARLAGLDGSSRVQEFVLVFASIVIEAVPFILAGALVSALIAVYVPDRTFARLKRLPTAVQVPGALACAFAFPVCECASVPVARRLIARGIHPVAGISFMLAAPVVNPVVLGSTWIAYGGTGLAAKMTVARALCGIVVAVVAAVALQRFVAGSRAVASACCGDGDACRGAHGGRLSSMAGHLASDFVFMAKFLVLGAAIAALLQTAVPQDALSSLASLPVLGPLALMVMAFLLSLCSEADAFVAISFGAFSFGAQLAFLAFGPVLDVKLAILYGAAFRRSFAPVLALVTVPLLLVVAVVFDAVLA
jgi:uncharacterized protein